MNSQLKQPLVLTAIGATLAVAVVYAAVPLVYFVRWENEE